MEPDLAGSLAQGRLGLGDTGRKALGMGVLAGYFLQLSEAQATALLRWSQSSTGRGGPRSLAFLLGGLGLCPRGCWGIQGSI